MVFLFRFVYVCLFLNCFFVCFFCLFSFVWLYFLVGLVVDFVCFAWMCFVVLVLGLRLGSVRLALVGFLCWYVSGHEITVGTCS